MSAMSIPPTDDRISAYLDGELAPSEQEEMVETLAEAEEVRDMIDELRDLGDLLRESPVPEFEGLRDSVLPQIQPQSTTVAASSLPERRRPWMWPSVAAVLLVGTFGLLVVTAPVQNAPLHAPDSMLVDAEFVAITPNFDVSEAVSGVEVASTAALERAAGADPGGTPLQQTLRRLGRAPTTGDLVAYLDDQDDEPVLVELTVVDVVQAVDELHVLLRQQGVVEATPHEPTPPTKPQTTGKHYAVYIEAPFSCVENVIHGMGASSNTASMTNGTLNSPVVTGEAAPGATTLALSGAGLARQAPASASGGARSLDTSGRSVAFPYEVQLPSPALSAENQPNGTLQYRPPTVPMPQPIGQNGILLGIPDVPRLKQQLSEEKLRRWGHASEERRAVSERTAPESPDAARPLAEPAMRESDVAPQQNQAQQVPVPRQLKALLILEEPE